MNLLKKTISKQDLIPEFLQSLNGLMKLSPRTLELMAEFIKLDISYISEPGKNKNIANTKNRKHIIKKLGITKDNLSRYIKTFVERGILVKGPAEDALRVWEPLIPTIIGDRIQITMILHLKDLHDDKEH